MDVLQTQEGHRHRSSILVFLGICNIGSPEGVVMVQGPGEKCGEHRQQQAPLHCLWRMEDDLS